MKIYFCQAEANKPPYVDIPHVRKKVNFESGDEIDWSCSYLLEGSSFEDINKQITTRAILEKSYYPKGSSLKCDYAIDFGKDKDTFIGRFDMNTKNVYANDLKKDIKRSLLYYSGKKKFASSEEQKEYNSVLNTIIPKDQQEIAKKILDYPELK